MRGHDSVAGSRFSASYEMDQLSKGVDEDAQAPLQQWVQWYRYSPEASRVDPVYDVGDMDGGRVWSAPMKVMVLRASIEQGSLVQNDRGYYTVDNLYFLINYGEAKRKLPSMLQDPDVFLRDRIRFYDKVYEPTQINTHARLADRVLTFVVKSVEVKGEEMINDPQFNWLVSVSRTARENTFTGTDALKVVNAPTPVEDYPTPADLPSPTPDFYEDGGY